MFDNIQPAGTVRAEASSSLLISMTPGCGTGQEDPVILTSSQCVQNGTKLGRECNSLVVGCLPGMWETWIQSLVPQTTTNLPKEWTPTDGFHGQACILREHGILSNFKTVWTKSYSVANGYLVFSLGSTSSVSQAWVWVFWGPSFSPLQWPSTFLKPIKTCRRWRGWCWTASIVEEKS